MSLLYEYEKTVVLRIINLTLMKFSLLPCGLSNTPFLAVYILFSIPSIYSSVCYTFKCSSSTRL